MKKILLYFLLCLSFTGFAQDWAPFKTTDVVKQFVAEDSMQAQLRLRYIYPIQSVAAKTFSVTSNETTVVFQQGYSALKLFYRHPFSPAFPYPFSKDIIKGRILGDTARIFSDSTMFTSIDSLGFTLNFYHSYKQGMVWEFGHSVDFELVGTVDSLYTESIEGTIDSIAKISLVVLDFMQFVVNSHPFNNQEILISKNHGLISTLDFTHLSDSSFKYNYYVGLQDSILLNDHASLTVGDEFHFQTIENNYGPYLYSRINNRISVLADSIIGTRRKVDYKLEKWRVSPVSQIFSDGFFTREFELDSIYTSNKSMINESNPSQSYFTQMFGVSSTTGCVDLIQSTLGPSEFRFTYPILSNEPDSIQFVGGSLAGGPNNIFIGIGAEFYSYGHGGVGSSILSETIVYIKKGNQTWGTPLNLTVGMQEVSQNGAIKLYPNPASNQIQLGTEERLKSVLVSDVNGKLVEVNRVNNLIDVSNLSSGLYFIQVETENGMFREKFIKQ
tara:strand:+ start:521 stop:2020 length:1500 start_codon:yes stop_codon:yes gene_type:complete